MTNSLIAKTEFNSNNWQKKKKKLLNLKTSTDIKYHYSESRDNILKT